MKSFGRFWRFIENMLQVFSNMFDFALMLLLSIWKHYVTQKLCGKEGKAQQNTEQQDDVH